MDFYRSSTSNEVVEAIGLGVNVSDIVAVQTTFKFEDVLYLLKTRKIVFLP
jgi:hypothetical protein